MAKLTLSKRRSPRNTAKNRSGSLPRGDTSTNMDRFLTCKQWPKRGKLKKYT